MRAFIYCCTIICLTLLTSFPIVNSKDTLCSTELLRNNETLVSARDVFELGLFKAGKTSSSSRWYLGIWYKKIQEKTVVWVANRDTLLPNLSSSTLKVGDGGNLVPFYGKTEKIAWSTNETLAVNPVAQLLDSGNLVLREAHINNSPNEFLWQSFDYPTDTLLPDMKLGWNTSSGFDRYITSWKSKDDPSTGDYSFKLDYRGVP